MIIYVCGDFEVIDNATGLKRYVKGHNILHFSRDIK